MFHHCIRKTIHLLWLSLLSTVGKVMEKIINKHIFNFFKDHDVYNQVLCLVIQQSIN